MFKKSLLFCLLILTSTITFSQELLGSGKAINKLKEKGLQVLLGDINPEVDDAFKAAIEKYWDFSSYEFVNSADRDKDRFALQLADYEAKGFTKTWTYSMLSIKTSNWLTYSSELDNLKCSKISYGIVSTNEDMRFWISIYIFNLNAQAKWLHKIHAENKEWSSKSWKGYKERLKTTTILIPEDYLNNGLTKNAFRQIRKKEFVSLNEISQRMENGKTKNVSLLQVYRAMSGCYLKLIDLETGDCIYVDHFDKAFDGSLIGLPDKLDDKAVNKQIENMYQP